MFNSFIVYKKYGGEKRFLQFKLNLIQFMLQEGHIDVDISEAGQNQYVGRHYPELILPTENRDKPPKQCVVCTKDGRRKDSQYPCKVCANYPGLCPALCFERYYEK